MHKLYHSAVQGKIDFFLLLLEDASKELVLNPPNLVHSGDDHDRGNVGAEHNV